MDVGNIPPVRFLVVRRPLAAFWSCIIQYGTDPRARARCRDENRTTTTWQRGAGVVCHQILCVHRVLGGLRCALVCPAKPIIKCAAISMEGRSYGWTETV